VLESSFDEIQAKLEKTDATGGCSNGEGNGTHIVNDSVFPTGKPNDAYRAVTTRRCDGRGDSDFFMSIFDLATCTLK
jgi:hypothetical protein